MHHNNDSVENNSEKITFTSDIRETMMDYRFKITTAICILLQPN